MRQGLGTGERQRYDSALAGLWLDLSRTLGQLETIATSPDELDEDAFETLPPLQYALHRAGELAAGIDPPPGAASAHAELASALEDARDATGEVIEAVDVHGPVGAALLVHEWRGALFRVRLARHRLASAVPAPIAPVTAPQGLPLAALLALGLGVAGTVAFTAGAILAVWPLWALGLTLVAGSLFVYRP